jgi:hypothetical protein
MEIVRELPKFANRCALCCPPLVRRPLGCERCGFAGVAAAVAFARLWAETVGRIFALAHGSRSPTEFTVLASGVLLGLRAGLAHRSCGFTALLLG